MKTSGANRIAERYVKALFEVAQTASAVNAVESDMLALGNALENNADFRDFLTNPLLTRDLQADAMASILATIKAHEVTRQFTAMLIRLKRLPILPEISEMYVDWARAARGEISAELISAGALKPEDVALVGQRLGKTLGKKVNLEVHQDSALLGGVVVKIGSRQLDASLAGKMARLRLELQGT